MPSSVNQVANATPEATWEDDCWKVPLDKYQTTVYALTQAGVRFEPIPTQVLSALSAADDSNNDWQAGNSRMDEEGYAKGIKMMLMLSQMFRGPCGELWRRFRGTASPGSSRTTAELC